MRYLSSITMMAVILLITACTTNSLAPSAAEELEARDLQLVEEKQAEADRRIAEHEATILNHPGYLETAGKTASPLCTSLLARSMACKRRSHKLALMARLS